MKRFTILALMAAILVFAIGFAALRIANDHWAGVLLLGTLAILGVSLLGAAKGRPGWRGFAVFCGGYFVAYAFLPASLQSRLPTTQALESIHWSVAPPISAVISYTSLTAVDESTGKPVPVMTSSPLPQVMSFTGPAKPPSRWTKMLPGAANHDAFMTVGHCVFSILFGMVGVMVALGFERRPEVAQEATASS